jgi:cytosine deaminase
MLEVAHMGLHVAQMTSQAGMRQCFDAVTVNAARVMGLDGYGIDVGRDANFVLLQARDPVEAIRLRAPGSRSGARACCWHRPRPAQQLSLPGRMGSTAFMPAKAAGG